MPLTRPINNPVPFATSGLKNLIPVPTAFGGAASMTNGFPAETMTPIVAGGTPPAGQDMNGILHQLSSHSVWLNAGGQYRFDAALATAIGGYPAGAVLQTDDGLSAYVSTIDHNTHDLNTDQTGWKAYAGQALAQLMQLPVNTIVEIDEILTAAQFATKIGYGTWAVYGAGRVVIGAGETTDVRGETLTFAVGDALGEFKHVQTDAELAKHSHRFPISPDGGQPTPSADQFDLSSNLPTPTFSSVLRQDGVLSDNYTLIPTEWAETGDSDPMNVVQPYVVASRFKRTA
jgi:hypothetical protein